ncbi:MAG: hypothetical protein RQ743_13685 [Bacteroidales bacterium]|nr:hypothetical protein [Bacteroidales bacterium]
MKNLFLLIPVIAFVISACQQTAEPIDMEAEKDAIMKVIQNESEFARDGKLQEFYNLYLKDESTLYLGSTETLSRYFEGYNEIESNFQFLAETEDMEYSWITISKNNPKFKIYQNTAWVVCENIWQGEKDTLSYNNEGMQVTFLEKIEDDWKISFIGFLPKLSEEE